MFTLVRFETAFVLECALTRLSRQGYVGFEAEGCVACVPDFCLWVEGAGLGWLLSWACDRRVFCEVVDLNS